MQKKILILATATENIMSWIALYYHSLLQYNDRSRFDLVILSFPSAFKDVAKERLREMGIILFEDDMNSIMVNKFNAAFAESKNIYRLKHLGKAYLCNLFLKNNPFLDYEHVIVSDLDIIFQSSLNSIVHSAENEKIYGAQEIKPLKKSPSLVRKLNNARKVKRFSKTAFDLERHEINYGFFGGKLKAVKDFLCVFLKFMESDEMIPLLESETGDFHGYHEQDFLRLFFQDRGYDTINLVESDILVHLSQNEQNTTIQRIDPIAKTEKNHLVYPKIVHFAGGVWDMFPEIQEFLSLNHFDSCENSLYKYWSNLYIGIDPGGLIFKTENAGVDNCHSQFRKALRYRKVGKQKEAITVLRPLLNEKELVFDASIQMGLSLIESGEVETGYLHLKPVMKHMAEYHHINFSIARTLERVNENQAAVEIIEKLTSCFPENYDYFISYIKLLIKTSRQNEAHQLFRQYQRIGSTHHVFKDIECYLLLGELDEAIERCLKILADWPTWTAVKIKLSHLYIKKALYENAVEVFREVLDEDPHGVDVGLKFVEVLLKCGKRREALERYDKLMANYGENTRIKQSLHEKIKKEIENADYWYGCFLKNQSDFHSAIRYLDKVERSNDNYYTAKRLIADTVAQIGRGAEAEDDHERAFEQYREAIERFKRLHDEKPKSKEIFLNISDVYKYLKDYDNAMKYIELFESEQGGSDFLEEKKAHIALLQRKGHDRRDTINKK